MVSTTGLLCYDDSDLIRDGYISNDITIVHDLLGAPTATLSLWERRLRNPPKGTTYTPVRNDDGVLTEISERRKILPANQLQIEIKFSKTMRNAVTNPIDPSMLMGLGFAGSILSPMIFPKYVYLLFQK